MSDTQVSQWCPILRSVVPIVVRGEVRGSMVDGEVVLCEAYSNGSCKEIHSSFCLVGKKIWTNIGA
jgi:hypothetical protein